MIEGPVFEFDRAFAVFLQARRYARGRRLAGKPQPGDLLSVQGRLGVYHHGICVEETRVIHASKDAGEVVETSLLEFSGGHEVRLVKRPQGFFARWTAVMTARGLLRTPYHVFKRNCEHAASEAVEGKPRSLQVQAGLYLTLMAAKDYCALKSWQAKCRAEFYRKPREEFESRFGRP